MQQLILGGARSGKSQLAQQLALSQEQQGQEVLVVVTADSRHNDNSMDERIQKHQQQRPKKWQTIECPLLLATTLAELASPNRCILVDCLSLWLSNCLLQHPELDPAQHGQQLLEKIQNLPGTILFVSNEVGLGVVPMGQLSRDFVDHSGFLHQQLAQHCQRVIFTAAGLPLVLKGPAL